MAGLLIYVTDEGDYERAEGLGRHLGAEVVKERPESDPDLLVLTVDRRGLSLSCDGAEMYGDLSHMTKRLKHNNLSHEMLVKAAKYKDRPDGSRMRAFDATAGMGEDSLLMAAAGFEVDLYEYNPVTAALLADQLERAAKDPELADIVSRMHFHEGDSTLALQNLKEAPDLVFLDPMFPARKKSGQVKKKLHLLQHLETPCRAEDEMFDAAIQARPYKIIVKRPAKGELLAGRKPAYQIKGSVIRYDCYVFPENQRI